VFVLLFSSTPFVAKSAPAFERAESDYFERDVCLFVFNKIKRMGDINTCKLHFLASCGCTLEKCLFGGPTRIISLVQEVCFAFLIFTHSDFHKKLKYEEETNFLF